MTGNYLLQKLSLLVLIICNLQLANAQNNNTIENDIFATLQNNDNSNYGEITLYQDVSLFVLIDRHKRLSEGILQGYRIQIYRGSGQSARSEVEDNQQKLLQSFPSFDSRQIYPIYEAPYFKLRIGDYRNKNEAFEILSKIKQVFPNAYIVNSSINFPKLETPVTDSSKNEK